MQKAQGQPLQIQLKRERREYMGKGGQNHAGEI